MRIMALATKILRQIIRDKRTVALLIFAPIFVLTMLHFVFNGEDYVPKLGLVQIPDELATQINFDDVKVTEFNNRSDALNKLEAQEIDGYLEFKGKVPSIMLEGSDSSVSNATIKWLQSAFKTGGKSDGLSELKINYLYGSDDLGMFDYFGPVLLGFFVFFFVFLIAGVSFLRERTTGTLERLLSSPLRRWEIVIGYVIGFGIFTVIQSTIIAAFVIYILGMVMEGAFIYVLLITLLLALTALTLGILLSSFAKNELQMMQFIPIFVVPQIFFSGLFNLETIPSWLSWIGSITPLNYAAGALRNVMVKGYGWSDIYINILVLLGFSLLFIVLNIVSLRKYRRI